jgi:hypothetical protein
MTVEVRQAGSEWLVEVKGEPIGVADSMAEADALAHYWQARLDCIARWRGVALTVTSEPSKSLVRLREPKSSP